MSYWGIRKTIDLGTYTINGANTIAFAPGQPIDIMRIILVYTTANSGAGNVLALQRRPVAGTAANQEALGTVTTTAAIAAGQVEYIDVGKPIDLDGSVQSDGSVLHEAGDGVFQINPGQDFAIVSGGEGTAGVVTVYLEVLEQPFTGDRVEDATELTRSA
jgi:hypothetical protein